MRKRNISYFLDNFFWFILYLLPVICYFALVLSNNYNSALPSFVEYLLDNFMSVNVSNVFISSISGIFGTGGVLPLFNTSSASAMPVLVYLSYFVTVYFIHFCVDVLMLLPRMLMHLMDKFGGC